MPSHLASNPASHPAPVPHPPLPLAEGRHFRDAQEQAAALAGWNQHYLQLSAGRFQGQLSQVQGSGIRIFVERVQQSVLQIGLLPSGVLALGVPLDASGGGVFCGRNCGVDSLHLFSGNSGFEFRTSQQHTMLGIELRLPAEVVVPVAVGICSHAKTPTDAVRSYVLALYHAAQRTPGLLSNPAVVGSVTDYLLDRLPPPAGAAVHGHSSQRQAGTLAHWALVQRCMAWLDGTWENAPTVMQMGTALHVSRRTLQNAFAQVLGMSPLAYIKALRLQHARQALKTGHPVTDAATASGFWHFGHFSHDYQQMFGELPSQTLRARSEE
ncbi:MAG: helix-turn-helix domain-containing protein [Rhodoferax sp.]|nr:helix-turn-helix domain-containing protein [Rhodoferax sp.]